MADKLLIETGDKLLQENGAFILLAPDVAVDLPSTAQPSQPMLFSTRSHQGLGIAQTTHVEAPFVTPMFAGNHPDQSRAFLAPHIPLPISQTTHVEAPFLPEMILGSKPDQARHFQKPKLGWQDPQLTFEVQMTPDQFKGWQPDRYRQRLAPKIPLPLSQTTHVVAPFTNSMSAGWQPPSKRERLAPKIPLPLGPQQAVNIINEVSCGVMLPDDPVLFKRRGRVEIVQNLTFDVQMTPEMFKGWQPDRFRQFTAPRILLPTSQVTHVEAAFSQDMVKGWVPDQARHFVKPRLGWQDSQLTFIIQMTPEMFAGLHPDAPRLWLAPRIPLPLGQPSPTAAPLSVEMSEGGQPDQPRLFIKPKVGWETSQPTVGVQMTPEMWAGWHPDLGRIFLAPRIPLPLAQPSHQAAAISPEMIAGNLPDRPRLFVLIHTGRTSNDLGFVVAAVRLDLLLLLDVS